MFHVHIEKSCSLNDLNRGETRRRRGGENAINRGVKSEADRKEAKNEEAELTETNGTHGLEGQGRRETN